ncbi:MAG: HAMP domain-containing protein [Candidatus Binatia bacterium]
MPEETFAFEGEKPARQAGLRFEGVKLKWKITATVVGIILLGTLVIAATTYTMIGRVARDQMDSRASIIAATLSDATAGHVSKRSFLELHAFVSKYARLEGVAYAFIQDGQGEIVAHSFKSAPTQLRQSLSSDERRQSNQRTVSVNGKPVYETRVPILEGQVGTVHVGMWGDVVKNEIRQSVTLLIAVIAGVIFMAVVASVFLAHRIVEPIQQLTDVAARISTGDLDSPVKVESQDEVGDLARSIERMRTSLKAAMWRLSRA